MFVFYNNVLAVEFELICQVFFITFFKAICFLVGHIFCSDLKTILLL